MSDEEESIEEAEPYEEVDLVRFLKTFVAASSRHSLEVSTYDESLNAKGYMIG